MARGAKRQVHEHIISCNILVQFDNRNDKMFSLRNGPLIRIVTETESMDVTSRKTTLQQLQNNLPFCQVWIHDSEEPVVIRSSGVAHLSLVVGTGNLADPTVINCDLKGLRYDKFQSQSCSLR